MLQLLIKRSMLKQLELCDILVLSGDLGLCETGIEVYRQVAFCVEGDVDSSQPAVVEHGFILSPIVLLPV